MPRIYGNLQEPRRSWKGARRFAVVVFWTVGLVFLVYLFFFSRVFTVKTVEVEGTLLADAEALAATVPKGQRIWSLSDELLNELIRHDPVVRSARLFRGLPSSVRVVVQERQAVAAWLTAGTLNLVDENGIVFRQFAENETPADGRYAEVIAGLLRIVDTHNVPVREGQTVAGQGFITFVQDTMGNFAEYVPDIAWERAEIEATLYDLKFVSATGLAVTFNTLADSGAQVRNFARLRDQASLSERAQVDLRVDTWAYVREE